jgi:hypothetical protein
MGRAALAASLASLIAFPAAFALSFRVSETRGAGRSSS